jgi:hypothetical protein
MKRQTDEQVELYAERDAYGAGAEFPVNRTPFTVADDPPSEGELRTAVSQLSHGRCGGASGRGSTLQVPASFFGIKKNKGLKFHVTRCFDSRESKSRVTSPPPSMAMHPPPPLHSLSSPCAEESIDLSTLEHAASPGECSNVGRFFYFALLTAQHRANHTRTMMFFHFRQPNHPP